MPLLIAHFYRAWLLGSTWGNARQLVATGLLWIWSVRLTHSYFRRYVGKACSSCVHGGLHCCKIQPDSALAPSRENFQLGAREDFRYADMRVQYGKHWWWISFERV